MNELDQLKTILSKNNASYTKPRKVIFEVLQTIDQPMKPSEIARLAQGVDRASVYRTLELFAQLGVTTTILRGWIAYVELAEPFKAHHHHFECSRCGIFTEIESSSLEEALQSIARAHRFLIHQHTVELIGLCQDCKAVDGV